MNKKITLATIKSFIRKNKDNLYIKIRDSFDGMHDCCMPSSNKWLPVRLTDEHNSHNFGIDGAWFVGRSRDYFSPYTDGEFIGYNISNSCGHFSISIKIKLDV